MNDAAVSDLLAEQLGTLSGSIGEMIAALRSGDLDGFEGALKSSGSLAAKLQQQKIEPSAGAKELSRAILLQLADADRQIRIASRSVERRLAHLFGGELQTLYAADGRLQTAELRRVEANA